MSPWAEAIGVPSVAALLAWWEVSCLTNGN